MILFPTYDNTKITLLKWAMERIESFSCIEDLGNYYPIAVVDSCDEISLVAVYHRRQGENIEIMFACDNPMFALPHVARAVLDFGFRVIGVERITSLIVDGTEKSEEIGNALGFKREGILRKAYKGKDVIISGLLKDEFYRGRLWAKAAVAA